MKAPNDPRLGSPPVRSETNEYAFNIGQLVRLKGDFAQRFPKVELYKIVGKLPPIGAFPQYRIRSEGEPHDRVATQDRLEAVAASEAKTSLAAKVF